MHADHHTHGHETNNTGILFQDLGTWVGALRAVLERLVFPANSVGS